MATNFPTSIDSFTNPTSGDTLDSPSHAAQHTNINDAMVAVQTKLGVGSGTIGEWTAFTPSWNNVTVGNATQKAYYSVVNKIVHVAGEFVFGSTSAFTGSIGFASPVTVNGTVLGQFTGIGQVIVNGNQFGFAQRFGNDIFFYWLNTGAGTGVANMPNMNATGPKTFTTGDDIRWYLTYAKT